MVRRCHPARTDVVWIAANFENTIVGRDQDELVRGAHGWQFARRVEWPVLVRSGTTTDVGRGERSERSDDADRGTPVTPQEERDGAHMGENHVTVIVDHPSFDELIDRDAQLVKIGEGYEFSEGPVWNRREQALYFSDIPGDRRWRWTEPAGMELAATPTFKGNGLAYDVDGSLLVCEQVSSCLTRIRADGQRELVVWHAEGVYLNSPNDVVVQRSTAASTSPTRTTGGGTTGSGASESSCAT